MCRFGILFAGTPTYLHLKWAVYMKMDHCRSFCLLMLLLLLLFLFVLSFFFLERFLSFIICGTCSLSRSSWLVPRAREFPLRYKNPSSKCFVSVVFRCWVLRESGKRNTLHEKAGTIKIIAEKMEYLFSGLFCNIIQQAFCTGSHFRGGGNNENVLP